MDAPDFGAAAGFIAANARVIDRRRFGRLSRTGPAGPVRHPRRSATGRARRGAHLDHLAQGQRDDGGWTFNWPAWPPAAERDGRGHLTVAALRILRANGYLTRP